MIYFQCDYAEGAHPKIIEALVKTNFEQTVGYGMDGHCARAAELIKKAVGAPDARVHFVSGGTQANQIVIASVLKPHQGAVCVDTGHINCHETGAVEATGHKVIALPNVNGKLEAEALRKYLANFWADDTHEHIVEPGMVYISSPTEIGTVYSKAELEAVSAVCREYEIPLFLDGARLGYGMAAPGNDVTLEDLAKLTDVFYIGGTKCGALFGEAVVFCGSKKLDSYFRPMIKQHGAMLAKGRLLGIQFEVLFTDGLYEEITRNAVALAMRIRDAFAKKGCKFMVESPTNQQFPILPRAMIEALSKDFAFMVWPDNGEAEIPTRFCTSWATTEEQVNTLIKAIEAL